MKKLFFVLLLSCGLARSAYAADRVRITYASRSISSIMIFIANDRGFFKEENLEPQLILTRGTTAIAAAVTGDVEAIHIMGTAIRGIIQGLPLKVLAVNQKLPLFWLVTRPELKTFNDLKGKTMAVTTIGGSQQLAGFHMLRKGGIDPAKEITSMVSGDVPCPVASTGLGPGSYHGALSTHRVRRPGSLQAQSARFHQRRIRKFYIGPHRVRQSDAGEASAHQAHAARPDKGQPIFQTNENASAEILAKYLNVSQSIALETYRFSRPAFTRNSIPTDKEVEENLKADAQFLQLKTPVKSAAVFDFALQREVNNDLGVK